MPHKRHMRGGKRWGKLYPPPDGDNTLIPRQFACSIAPDPIAFLLPIGHQQATPLGLKDTSPAGNLLGRARFARHDELARTVPTVLDSLRA